MCPLPPAPLQPKKAADVTEVEDESGETERRVGREGEIVWGVCRLFASFNDTFIVRCLSAPLLQAHSVGTACSCGGALPCGSP